MGISLNDIERSWRKEVRKASAASAAQVSPWRDLFLFGGGAALVAPFALCVGLFVPFLGQVLCVALFLLSLTFIWVRRSFTLALAWVLGCALGFGVVGLVATQYGTSAAALYYLLIAFSVFISGIGVIALAGAIWQHFERGRLLLESQEGDKDR